MIDPDGFDKAVSEAAPDPFSAVGDDELNDVLRPILDIERLSSDGFESGGAGAGANVEVTSLADAAPCGGALM